MTGARYNTGKPCKRGHMSDRYVQGKACVECIRLRRLTKPQRSALNEMLAQARAADGFITYVPDKACPYGHRERYVVKADRCVECNRHSSRLRNQARALAKKAAK